MSKLYEEYKEKDAERLQTIFLNNCITGNLDPVKCILDHDDLRIQIDIHRREEEAFQWACVKGRLEVIKYLLELPNKGDRPNIHIENDAPFKIACFHGHWDVVRYFIYDCNLEKNENIIAYMNKKPEEIGDAELWFNNRELTAKLNEELTVGPNNKKSMKL